MINILLMTGRQGAQQAEKQKRELKQFIKPAG